MADLYVHLRMKECCRKALKSIDKKKKGTKGAKGLLGKQLEPWLGNMPIPAAEVAIGTLAGTGKADLRAAAGAAGSLLHHDVAGAAKAIAPMVTRELGDLVSVVRFTCKKVAQKHGAEHQGKGETKEAGFWDKLGDAF